MTPPESPPRIGLATDASDRPDVIVKFGPVFKVADGEQGVVEGYASTGDIDEMDDIILPSAYSDTLPKFMQYPAMMVNHDYSNAVGKYTDAKIDNRGLWVRGQISEAEPGLRQKVREGVYKAFSISGRVIESQWDSERMIRTITKLELYEISIVWLPANRQARIEIARSLAAAIGGLAGKLANNERSLASATSNGEITPLFNGRESVKEALEMTPEETGALVEQTVSKQMTELKTELKDHLVTAAQEKVDVRFMGMRDTLDAIARMQNEIREKAASAVTAAEFAQFKDVVSEQLAPLLEHYQRMHNRGGDLLPFVFDSDDCSELCDRSSITPDEQKFADEIGTDPILARLQTTNPKKLGAVGELVKQVQDVGQEVAIIHSIMSRSQTYRDRGGIRSLKRYQRFRRLMAELAKAAPMDTATANEGTEWVPTILSSEYVRRLETEAVVASLFRRATMPAKTWDWPVVGAGATAYAMQESITTTDLTAALTASAIASTKATLTAKKIGVWVPITSELTEEAVGAGMAIINDELIIAIVRGIDNAIINGDDTNIGVAAANQDNDITGAFAIEKRWDGLRLKALAGTTTAGGAAILTSAMLRTNRKNLGGARNQTPSTLAHIVSPKSYINLLSDANVITVDKFGPLATILTGVLAAVDGIPLIVSDFVREDVSATGVNTAVGPNTLTTALTVHRPSWAIGDRRMITVKSQEYIVNDNIHMVATWRGDFCNVLTTTPVTIAVNVAP